MPREGCIQTRPTSQKNSLPFKLQNQEIQEATSSSLPLASLVSPVAHEDHRFSPLVCSVYVYVQSTKKKNRKGKHVLVAAARLARLSCGT